MHVVLLMPHQASGRTIEEDDQDSLLAFQAVAVDKANAKMNAVRTWSYNKGNPLSIPKMIFFSPLSDGSTSIHYY